MDGTIIIILVIIVLVILVALGVGGYFLYKVFSSGGKGCPDKTNKEYLNCWVKCGEENGCCGEGPPYDCKNIDKCSGTKKTNMCQCVKDNCYSIVKDCSPKDPKCQ